MLNAMNAKALWPRNWAKNVSGLAMDEPCWHLLASSGIPHPNAKIYKDMLSVSRIPATSWRCTCSRTSAPAPTSSPWYITVHHGTLPYTMLKTQEEVPYPSSDILGTMLHMLLKKPWKPGCIQHFSILMCLYIFYMSARGRLGLKS